MRRVTVAWKLAMGSTRSIGTSPALMQHAAIRLLGLSDQETQDLLAFLLSLSSDQPLIVEPPDRPRYEAMR